MNDMSEELQELAELTSTIFASKVTTERLRELETAGSAWDEDLWAEVCQAGLTSLSLPEDVGGLGFGLAAMCTVAEVQGRYVAPIPLWTAILASHIISLSTGDFADLLADVITGEARVTLALEEPGIGDALNPAATATTANGAWVLTGEKTMVPHAASATHFLTSARSDGEAKLFLVDRAAVSENLSLMTSTNLDHVGYLDLTGVPAREVPGVKLLGTLIDMALVVLSALQLGAGHGAVELSASYVSEREQFGRPIGTFQSVQHQLADAVIGLDGVELTMRQAIAHLDAGDPRASRATRVASWWARTAGTRALYTCQHVHGGIGVDVDYPLHRFFLWARQAQNTLGNPEQLLAEIGTDLVARGAEL